MIRFTAIWISLTILIQSFNFGVEDVLQIDDLIDHVSYHADTHGDNILVFLSKHYGALKYEHHKKHQEEKDDHEQLPFQQQTHVTSITVFIFSTSKIELNLPEFIEFESHHFFYQAPSSSLHSLGLFQPPKYS